MAHSTAMPVSFGQNGLAGHKANRLKTKLFLTALLCLLLSPLSTPSNAQQRSPEHQQYCLRLEGQLAKTYQSEQGPGDNRAKLKISIRNVENVYHRLNNEADRRNCYQQFFFSKELRRTPRCIRIHRKIQNAKRQLEKLNRQMERSIQSGSNKKHQRTDLIQALARNKCGYQYEKEARKRNSFNNWFDDAFFGGTRPDPDYNPDDRFQFATHRTLCVRMCDGYYFPMSFATTQNRFSQDENVCQSKCAAPAKLFTYPNPGGTPEQMYGIDGQSYADLKNAWRFKKEFVKGCSCKATEYDPVLLEAKPALDPAKEIKKTELDQSELEKTKLENVAPTDKKAESSKLDGKAK